MPNLSRRALLGASTAALFAIALAGCSTSQQTMVVADATSGLQSAQSALNFYGIAKGIALVAETAVPTLAPALGVAISAADPVVVKLQSAVTAAQLDLPLITSLVAQINAQAQAIETMAAPVIKVVPAKTTL